MTFFPQFAFASALPQPHLQACLTIQVMAEQKLLPVQQTNLQRWVVVFALLQISDKYGEVLGYVEYAAAIHRPFPSMGQAKAVKAQPGREMGSTDSTILAATLQHADLPQHRHFVKQSAKQKVAVGTASMASQDSTALSAFHGAAIPGEWNVHGGQPQDMHLGAVSDEEEAGRSLNEHEDADSLIPSGSGVTRFAAALIRIDTHMPLLSVEVSCISAFVVIATFAVKAASAGTSASG